jgi:outer membrane protein assembly factor BamB
LAAETPLWGFAAHPLVDGDLLICMVGGEGQRVVAFDKHSGEVRWKALDGAAGYCPPSVIEAGGTRQLIIFHPDGVQSLDPRDGSPHWMIPIQPDFEMSITRPMVSGNRMYASAIRTQAVMIELSNEEPAAEVAWRGQPKEAVHCSNSTPIFAGDVIYGTDCNIGSLIAVDAADGSQLWQTFQATRPEEERYVRHGTAFLTRLGESDRYYLFSETGDLIVASLTADGYREHGRFHTVEPTSEAFGRDVVWSHPAYAYRTAYIRNDKEIVAVDLSRP